MEAAFGIPASATQALSQLSWSRDSIATRSGMVARSLDGATQWPIAEAYTEGCQFNKLHFGSSTRNVFSVVGLCSVISFTFSDRIVFDTEIAFSYFPCIQRFLVAVTVFGHSMC